jgi:hypothetical protein
VILLWVLLEVFGSSKFARRTLDIRNLDSGNVIGRLSMGSVHWSEITACQTEDALVGSNCFFKAAVTHSCYKTIVF